ncbi:MAG: hypothetical protein ACRCY3_10155 [Sphingorhabdus sp.]
MVCRQDILKVLEQVEKVQLDAKNNGMNRPEDWQMQTITIRRKVAALMSDISQLVDKADGQIFDSATQRKARDHLSKLRSAIALHQASWPVVMIDSGGEDYRTSAMRVDGEIKDFLKWMRSQLKGA